VRARDFVRALTSSEYAIPQSLLLLSLLVMAVVTVAAAVWGSHRQLSRTTLQYASHSQPLQRQHTLRAPPLISSPLLVRRSLVIDGRAMGWLAHTPPHCVLGPSRFLQVTGGFVLSKGSSAALLDRCAIPCCYLLFVPWCSEWSSRVGSGLMWVCFCSDSVNRCWDTSCFFSPGAARVRARSLFFSVCTPKRAHHPLAIAAHCPLP
jgi:hypothetical protein